MSMVVSCPQYYQYKVIDKGINSQRVFNIFGAIVLLLVCLDQDTDSKERWSSCGFNEESDDQVIIM